MTPTDEHFEVLNSQFGSMRSNIENYAIESSHEEREQNPLENHRQSDEHERAGQSTDGPLVSRARAELMGDADNQAPLPAAMPGMLESARDNSKSSATENFIEKQMSAI